MSGALNSLRGVKNCSMKINSLYIKKHISACLVLVTGLLAFGGNAQASPHASFSVNHTSGCAPLSVQFTSTSTGAVSYFWDFGNGNTSTLPNPTDLYAMAGSYTVTLIAYDAGGVGDTAGYSNYINAIGIPDADLNCS